MGKEKILLTERLDIVINVSPAILIVFAKLIQMNLDGLNEFAKKQLGLNPNGLKEIEHITNELENKGFEGFEKVKK